MFIALKSSEQRECVSVCGTVFFGREGQSIKGTSICVPSIANMPNALEVRFAQSRHQRIEVVAPLRVQADLAI
jgi:hypothetical protein